MRRRVCVAALAGTLLAAAAQAPARALPACVQRLAQPARELGSGKLRWFGLSVYDATLWSGPAGIDASALGSQALALRLRYARSIGGAELADASAKLMRGQASPQELQHWRQRMRAVFPDVHPGNTLCGVYLPHAASGPTTQFLAAGKLLGSIDGEDFARAFFGIWLGPHATHAQLRRELLAGAGP